MQLKKKTKQKNLDLDPNIKIKPLVILFQIIKMNLNKKDNENNEDNEKILEAFPASSEMYAKTFYIHNIEVMNNDLIKTDELTKLIQNALNKKLEIEFSEIKKNKKIFESIFLTAGQSPLSDILIPVNTTIKQIETALKDVDHTGFNTEVTYINQGRFLIAFTLLKQLY